MKGREHLLHLDDPCMKVVVPSAMFVAIEAADLRNCAVRPYRLPPELKADT
jgi:hypothetical protein